MSKRLQEISTELSFHETNIRTNATNIIYHEDKIKSIQTMLTEHGLRIADNEILLDNHAASLKDHYTKIEKNIRDISVNASNIQSNLSKINANSQKIADDRVVTDSNTSRIVSLENSSADHTARIVSIETELTSIDGQITTIQNNHNELKTSNLYQHCKFTADISKLSELVTEHADSAHETNTKLLTHLSDKSNPHNVTKTQIGLSNCDNTSDANKPISNAQKQALDNKVDKIIGKGLSERDYTQQEKTKLAGISDNANNYAHPATHPASIITEDAAHKFVSDSEKAVYLDKYTKAEVDNKISQISAGVDWKASVNTYTDIVKTYPSPKDGWTVNVNDTDITYRYTGSTWIPISANSIPLATASLDGKMSAAYAAKLNGIANNANNYVHPGSGTNPHGTTKADTGLGNCDNTSNAYTALYLTVDGGIWGIANTAIMNMNNPTEEELAKKFDFSLMFCIRTNKDMSTISNN